MHQTTLIRRKVLTDRISKTKPNLGRFLRDIWKSWERQGKSCLAHRPEQKALTQSKPSTRPSSQFKPLFLLTLLPKCAIQQTVVFHQRAQPSSMGGDQAEPWSHTTTIFQTEAISLSPETERNRESYGAIPLVRWRDISNKPSRWSPEATFTGLVLYNKQSLDSRNSSGLQIWNHQNPSI